MEGTLHKDKTFVCDNTGTITIGSTTMTFTTDVRAEQLTTALTNSTGTVAAANSAITVENPSGSQSLLAFTFAATPQSAVRADSSGNMNLHYASYLQAYASLDNSVPVLNAQAAGLLVGGGAGGAPAAKLDVIGAVTTTPTARLKGVASQTADMLQIESSSGTADLLRLTAGGLLRRSVGSVTASTTQTQGNGALTKDLNLIGTVANVNDTVTLPVPANGMDIVLINLGANRCKVFPSSGTSLGNGSNIPCSITPGGTRRFSGASSAQWVAVSETRSQVTLANLLDGGSGTGPAGAYRGEPLFVCGAVTPGDGFTAHYSWSLTAGAGGTWDSIPGISTSGVGFWIRDRESLAQSITGAGSVAIRIGTPLVLATSGTPTATLWDANYTPGFTVIVECTTATSVTVQGVTQVGAGYMAWTAGANGWYLNWLSSDKTKIDSISTTGSFTRVVNHMDAVPSSPPATNWYCDGYRWRTLATGTPDGLQYGLNRTLRHGATLTAVSVAVQVGAVRVGSNKMSATLIRADLVGNAAAIGGITYDPASVTTGTWYISWSLSHTVDIEQYQYYVYISSGTPQIAGDKVVSVTCTFTKNGISD
jgi:hypothetical protein